MSMRLTDIPVVNSERLAPELQEGLAALETDAIVRRIWERDWTVWKPVDREISNRLGWLSSPAAAGETLSDLEAFAASVRGVGLARAVVLGMGGSSLAPEVYARLFGTEALSLELEVLDTTEPAAVAAAGARFDPRKTLFVVSSKSGTTAEVLALLAYFYDRTRRELGTGHAGSRFVAITDPGTPLEALARELRFRRVFLGQPEIGGRFSALSVFGLVPAALKGIDLGRLLAPARAMSEACRIERTADNPGALLGAILGTAALKGMDKLTFLMPQRLKPLAGWLEQLVAESTGKEGRGIIPVVEDRPGDSGSYGGDRLFIEIGATAEPSSRLGILGPEGSGSPFVRLALDDPYDLAGHFFVWEFATAVAAHFMKINPFDQPDVESTKKRTREVLASSGGQGIALGTDLSSFAGGMRVAPPAPAESPEGAVTRFLAGRHEGDYLAILAFLPRSAAVEGLLSGLAAGLRLKTGLPVTLGFGPRYLHSTGQLHKGDGNGGLYLMLVATGLAEVEIPAVSGISRPAADFGSLFQAQARGDALALTEKGRRVLTVELAGPVEMAIATLSSFFG